MQPQDLPLKRSSLVRLGAFVAVMVAVAVCIGAGVRFFRPAGLLCETYIDGPVFGVEVGSPVRFRGIPIGKVRAVEFAWSRYGDDIPNTREGELAGRWARIVFAVDSKALMNVDDMDRKFRDEVGRGLRVSLKSQGIDDTGCLDLDYPAIVNDLPSPPWVPEHLYVPSVPSLMQTLAGAMRCVAEETAKVGALADSFIGSFTLALEEGRLPVADIADNLRRATASLDELLERLREDPSIVFRSNHTPPGSDPPER